MLNYHDVEGALPPAAVLAQDGKPLLSWRVLILPYIEQGELHKEFRLDEPWDSPHNFRLLSRMPRIYSFFDGSKTPEPYSTYYQVFVGKGTAFACPCGEKLADLVPGAGDTFLIVEAGTAVPWTKPADLPYAPDRPLPPLGGILRDGRFRAAMVDSSVRTIEARRLSDDNLRALITRHGRPAPEPDGEP
jgi:hypothetical protein